MRHAVLVVAFACLTACGGGSASPHARSTPATPATPSAAAQAPAAAGNPVTGADFCAFLSQQTPRLKTDGNPAGALADLAIEFASWLDTHQSEKPRTAADLDEASTGTCPATRAAVLTTLGKSSFEAALS